VPLENEPAVMTGVGKGEKAWLGQSVDWYMDPSRWGVHLAADGPEDWPRVRDASVAAPASPVTPVAVSDIETGDDRISFDVDRPGSPVLVKASYYPNWKVSGGEGPWRVSPNLMVVVPTERHVELHYGNTPVDHLGRLLTVLGFGALAGLIVLDRRRTWPAEDETGEVDDAGGPTLLAGEGPAPEEAGSDGGRVPVSDPVGAQGEPEHHEPSYRAQAAPQDGGARRPRFPDRDGDLGHAEPGPFGP
jgi:hypothetical protein